MKELEQYIIEKLKVSGNTEQILYDKYYITDVWTDMKAQELYYFLDKCIGINNIMDCDCPDIIEDNDIHYNYKINTKKVKTVIKKICNILFSNESFDIGIEKIKSISKHPIGILPYPDYILIYNVRHPAYAQLFNINFKER